jgi:cysteine synthase
LEPIKIRDNAKIKVNFIPDVLNMKIYNRKIQVEYEDAIETSKKLIKIEGIFVDISAGTAAWGAIFKASKEFKKGDNIVVELLGTEERYLSIELF